MVNMVDPVEMKKLEREYQIAEAKFEVADDFGFYLAVVAATLIGVLSERWWVGLISFVPIFITSRYEHRKKWEDTAKAYFEAELRPDD